jgi:signal transduction histidine kinase
VIGYLEKLWAGTAAFSIVVTLLLVLFLPQTSDKLYVALVEIAILALLLVALHILRRHDREQFEAKAKTLAHREVQLQTQAQAQAQAQLLEQTPVHKPDTKSDDAEKYKIQLAVEKERVAVLRRFLSDASHDLRTPLTNLKTSSYLVKRLAHDPDKQKHHIEVIEKQTSKLERLLTDFLMMSRLDMAATGEFQFGLVDINHFVKEVVESKRPLANAKNHTVVFEFDETLNRVLLDKGKFPLAVGNLFSNACTYTPHGGTITIRTYKKDDRIAIDFQDTGIGIKQEDLDKIFETFFRADDAKNADTGGAGLGLAIAKRIVEVHDGALHVESEPGKGSTFTIMLPEVGWGDAITGPNAEQRENA